MLDGSEAASISVGTRHARKLISRLPMTPPQREQAPDSPRDTRRATVGQKDAALGETEGEQSKWQVPAQ
jgi:hypothetical protein